MKNQTSRLTLEAFKAKANSKPKEANLDKIVGGILGACHTITYGSVTSGGCTLSVYDSL